MQSLFNYTVSDKTDFLGDSHPIVECNYDIIYDPSIINDCVSFNSKDKIYLMQFITNSINDIELSNQIFNAKSVSIYSPMSKKFYLRIWFKKSNAINKKNHLYVQYNGDRDEDTLIRSSKINMFKILNLSINLLTIINFSSLAFLYKDQMKINYPKKLSSNKNIFNAIFLSICGAVLSGSYYPWTYFGVNGICAYLNYSRLKK